MITDDKSYTSKLPVVLIVLSFIFGIIPLYFCIRLLLLFINDAVRISELGVFILGILTVTSFVFFRLIYRIKVFRIQNQRVTIKTLWGIPKSEFKLEDIVSCRTIHLPGDQKSIFNLKNGESVQIRRGIYYRDYLVIKKLMLTLHPQESLVNLNTKARAYRNTSILTFVFALIILGYSLILFMNKSNPTIETNYLKFLNGTLGKQPEITTDSRNHKSIHFEVKEYPEIIFAVQYDSYDAIQNPQELLSYAKAGDNIRLGVNPDNYQVYVLKSLKPTIDEFFSKSIYVYTVSINNVAYSTIEGYNTINDDHGKTKYFIFFVGITFLFVTLYYKRKSLS